MNKPDLRLLVHHHHIAHLDKYGTIWLSSVIGRWANALADYFSEVGLLMYKSEKRLPQQDTPLEKRNLRLVDLGVRKSLGERLLTPNPIRKLSNKVGSDYDILLIRGVTPHQFPIWQYTPTPYKAFLLVGSIHRQTRIPRSVTESIILFRHAMHIRELKIMAKHGISMLANSPYLVSEISNTIHCSALFVPTNSIRHAEFSPLRIKPISTPWKLLYVGRMDLAKGLAELIQALGRLNQSGYPTHLDIVGPFSEPTCSKLRLLANNMGIENSIHWHGLIPYGPELFQFYQQADAFILPTYTEGFPHVIWESIANSCPVITTAVGGIPALLKHEEHALLIPPRDVGSIKTAVIRLLTDSTLRQKMVIQSYRYALQFSVEACAQKMYDVLATKVNAE